ncbi:MAG: Zn-ribbon domain-containing OB-fold protein [Halobacteriota archaeon]
MNRVFECADCGRRSFYAKFRCLDCASAELLETEPGTGELLAITTVHVVPDGVREPNALGLAAFDGRANVIAQLEGDLEVGDSVRLAGEYELRQGADGPLTGGRLVAADS